MKSEYLTIFILHVNYLSQGRFDAETIVWSRMWKMDGVVPGDGLCVGDSVWLGSKLNVFLCLLL